MSLNPTRKREIIASNARKAGDSGSAEVQVAVLTARVEELTEHLKRHPKDHAARRGLMKLVGRSKRMRDYLRNTDIGRYRALVEKLGLRK